MYLENLDGLTLRAMSMTQVQELTFGAVDDLVGAYIRQRLAQSPPHLQYVPRSVGPLVELAFQSKGGRFGPVCGSLWLDQRPQSDLQQALFGSDASWLDVDRQCGFLRTIFDPLASELNPVRTGFLMAARKAAEAIGFPIAFAQTLAAAMREMESNIHEHSGHRQTGVIAFQAQHAAFEFVIADAGVGVLATLREAPEFRTLSDHGRAIHAALQEGTSRYGRAANRGMGFKDLFLGLANLNANLRFRSGDHALTISGPQPSLKTARLAQKPLYQGFLVAVRCELPRVTSVSH